MRKVAIIQARMRSTRLPGKVMKTLAGERVLWRVMTRVKETAGLDDVIVATSTEKADDVIADYCHRHRWPYHRGPEHDVLSRYVEGARVADADIVVRITCDCPFISPLIIDRMLEAFNPDSMDYMSTNYPKRSFPVGLDCEIMTLEALKRADRGATRSYDREHVTAYIYTHPDEFRLHGFACDTDMSHIRITLDTEEDYQSLQNFVATCPEICDPQSDVLDACGRYLGLPLNLDPA